MKINDVVTEGIMDRVKSVFKPKIKMLTTSYDEELWVRLVKGDEEIARFIFDQLGWDLEAQDMSVNKEYRGQGLAKMVYDTLTQKGYKIYRSQYQTDYKDRKDTGKHFWDKNRPGSVAGNVWEDDVSEGWKDKAAAAALVAAPVIGGIGISNVDNAPDRVVSVQGTEYVKHELPNDLSKVNMTTDDKGNKVYVWTVRQGMKPAYTYHYYAPAEGVKESLADTQQKIVDTIIKLEDRLKHAKTPEQWDNIKNRIDRLQAGLNRSKSGVAEDLRTENPCWSGYHPVGTKKKNGKTVPNCVPTESVAEGGWITPGLKLEPMTSVRDREIQRQQGLRPTGPQRLLSDLAGMLHITAPQLAALAQSVPGFPVVHGRKSAAQGSKGYYDLATFKRWVIDNNIREKIAAKKGIAEGEGDPEGLPHLTPELASHIADQINTEGPHAIVKSVEWGDGASEDLVAQIQDWLEDYAQGDVTEDWQKVNKHDKTDGMSKKAVAAYRRENPGSKLKTAVTTKPSKLKAGSKDAKRRKSFCARMSGVKGPMKDEHGKPTAKAKALSRWNC